MQLRRFGLHGLHFNCNVFIVVEVFAYNSQRVRETERQTERKQLVACPQNRCTANNGTHNCATLDSILQAIMQMSHVENPTRCVHWVCHTSGMYINFSHPFAKHFLVWTTWNDRIKDPDSLEKRHNHIHGSFLCIHFYFFQRQWSHLFLPCFYAQWLLQFRYLIHSFVFANICKQSWWHLICFCRLSLLTKTSERSAQAALCSCFTCCDRNRRPAADPLATHQHPTRTLIHWLLPTVTPRPVSL